MRRKGLAAVIGGIILIFVLFPQIVSESAKEGLLLWFQVVLPALLPFLVVSSVILGLGLSGSITRVAAPVLRRFFGISERGCYPVVIGMLSGYPLGAATVADLYQRRWITRREAQYILHFCNNASPMFLVEFVGVSCLGWKIPLLLLVLVYLAAWSNAFLERGFRHFISRKADCLQESVPDRITEQRDSRSLIQVLDESILHGFVVLTKVGGYIILFSILAGLLEHLIPCTEISKAMMVSLLEITTGAERIAVCSLPEGWKEILLVGASAFGGLSSVAQTASVLGETDLSIGRYVFAKMRQAFLAAVYLAVIISLFGVDVLH